MERDQDLLLMKGMPDARDYAVVDDESLDADEVWVLEATSKSGYKPKNREAKMLTGMIGKLGSRRKSIGSTERTRRTRSIGWKLFLNG